MMVRFHWTDRLCLFVGVSLLAAGVQPAAAQGSEHRLAQPWEVQWQLGKWQRDYEAVVADLKENTPRSNKHARKRAYANFLDVLDHALRGKEFGETAGRFLTMLAIAEARLGDCCAGAWHWQMAQNVSVELRNSHFDDFPDVAPFMKANLIPEKRWEGLPRSLNGQAVESDEKLREFISPPQNKTRVEPRYPAGLVYHRIGGSTVVEAIIDTQGGVRAPVVVRGSRYVSLDLAAMEALRAWTYEPATREGTPVSVYLALRVDFVL